MSIFGTPSPSHREALAARYRSLVADARRHRAIDPRLSDGEQRVVRAILDEPGSAAEAEAIPSLAASLFGIDGGAEDAHEGWPRTFAWLADVRRG